MELLEHLGPQGVHRAAGSSWSSWTRGVTGAAGRAPGRHHGLGVRRVGRDDEQPAFRPPGTPGGSRSPTAAWDVPARLAKSFENITTSATGWIDVACIVATLGYLSRLRPQASAPQVAA